jgi:hypothetical protein
MAECEARGDSCPARLRQGARRPSDPVAFVRSIIDNAGLAAAIQEERLERPTSGSGRPRAGDGRLRTLIRHPAWRFVLIGKEGQQLRVPVPFPLPA